MMDNGKWSRQNEANVLEVRDWMIAYHLTQGWSVIVDDTNLHSKHLARFHEIAELHEATVVVDISCLDVSLHECLERDRQRANPVGDKVILDMWNQFLRKQELPNDQKKHDCYVFDIDGTLAKMNGRHPYEWDKVGTDLPNKPVIDILRKIYSIDFGHIIIVSGRDAVCREATEAWLAANHIHYSELLMRPEGDKRPDTIVKSEIADAILETYNILGVFDDRDQVVAMWRERGIPCFQVDYGAF